MKKIDRKLHDLAKNWHGMLIITVDDKPGFGEWLNGQTRPYVEEDEYPANWAYYGDYVRFTRGLGVID